MGRRPRRRSARGVPSTARHHRAVGDARARARRADRGTGNRGADPPSRRAWRSARTASCSGVHVRSGRGARASASRHARRAPQAARRPRRRRTTKSSARTSPKALIDFARAENCTQLVLGASNARGWQELLRGLGDQSHHPALGIHRRARDLAAGRHGTHAAFGVAAPDRCRAAEAPAVRRVDHGRRGTARWSRACWRTRATTWNCRACSCSTRSPW